jgi:hypothetical protein
MLQPRSLVLLAACTVPLSLVACGSSDEGGTVIPEGTHYGFVVDKILLPANNVERREYALDLGAPKTSSPDGVVDNQLGLLLQTLGTMGFAVQPTVDAAVDQGNVLLLVDFQTKDFTSSSAAGLGVKLGDPATATPKPCAAGSTTDCRKHLAGTGTFTIAASSPSNPLLGGRIVGGTFNGGPGELTLQIALGSATAPLTLSLLAARAKATGISETGMDAVLGGAITQSELMTQVLPAVAAQIGPILVRDCTARNTPPNCGCTGTGSNVITLFDGKDGSTPDCMVTVAEIAQAPTTKGLLASDVCSSTTCAAADALSIGIKVHAVKAMFPQ